MLTLYPAIKPYATHELSVDDIHTLYIEEAGDPNGIPVLFLHGGPGAGCIDQHRRFFDPKRYRVVLFDQRGCGRSKPHASLENNTTQDLIQDLEKIRDFLAIEEWTLFGGSWGATLSLLYAQAHPDKVAALVLRGIFLGRKKDIRWFYQEGASRIFPDAWKDFLMPVQGLLNTNTNKSILETYYDILRSDDELLQMSAAKAWARWEATCLTLEADPKQVKLFTTPHRAQSLALIEAHYFVNDLFIEENQIIKKIDKISHIPGVIVHGRYDMVCPLDNAYELHACWEESELNIIRTAGHASTEPAIASTLVHAMNALAR